MVSEILFIKFIIYIIFLYYFYRLFDKKQNVIEGLRKKSKQLTYEQIVAKINANSKGIEAINKKIKAKSNLKDRVKELERKTEEMP